MGVPGVTLPDDPIQAQPSYAAARAAFEALPPVRILFDNGAGGATPGAPVPGFERSFSRFPLPGTRARSCYLAAGGALADAEPAAAGVDRFTWSRTARPPTNFTGNTAGGPNGLWTAAPPYRWSQHPAGTALSYVTAPLAADTAVVGGGALEAWIRSLGAAASTSRPRSPRSGPTARRRSCRAAGCARARASSTRAGARCSSRSRACAAGTTRRCRRAAGRRSRCRSTTRATSTGPGRGCASRSPRRAATSPCGRFGELQPRNRASVSVSRAPSRPSRLILPVVPGLDAPTALPPCPALRGQPCRPYQG